MVHQRLHKKTKDEKKRYAPPHNRRIQRQRIKSSLIITTGFVLLFFIIDLYLNRAPGTISPLWLGLLPFALIIYGFIGHYILYQCCKVSATIPNTEHTSELRHNVQPTIFFLGDSITQGTTSANFVKIVSKALPKYTIHNLGINSYATENILRTTTCLPKKTANHIIIMAGTNDIKGLFHPPWGMETTKSMQLSQPLSWQGFEQNITQTVRNALSSSPHVAVCTLPVFGEDLNSQANQWAQRANRIIEKIAASNNIHALPIWQILADKINSQPHQHPVASFMHWEKKLPKALLRHYIFKHDWDKIAKRWDHVIMTDGLHLNQTGAQLVANEVIQFIKQTSTSNNTTTGT